MIKLDFTEIKNFSAKDTFKEIKYKPQTERKSLQNIYLINHLVSKNIQRSLKNSTVRKLTTQSENVPKT